MNFRSIIAALISTLALANSTQAFAQASPAAEKPDVVSASPSAEKPGVNFFPEHHFQFAASDAKKPQVAINFGLLQIAEGGFNIAGELRYRRFWLEYSHGMDLTMNNVGGIGLSSTERAQNVHVFVPYTTGLGVGMTVIDEVWLGVELKSHRFEVNAPGGPVASYQTYSVGPVIGYKLFVYKGLFANAYARFWPNVASTLDDNKIALSGSNGTVIHSAHDFGFFANASIGYAFDL